MRKEARTRFPVARIWWPLLFITLLTMTFVATRPLSATGERGYPGLMVPVRAGALACAPVQPIRLRATRVNDQVVLSWPNYPENWYVRIYHGTTPYFPLNDTTWVDTVTGPQNTWTDGSAVLTNGDDYYAVKAQGCGGDTYVSNAVGIMSFRPPLQGTPFGTVHQGEATYYWEANGTGNCMFPATDDVMIAALSHVDYGDAAGYCGATARVRGPYGEIQVRIVDMCPDAECYAGHLDLHPDAFAQIAPMDLGRVDITWQLVSPPIDGNIVYHFKTNSNPYWAAVQVRNHRNPLARFDVLQGGRWVSLPRQSYNYFLAAGGMGPGPYTFRVTDIFGNHIVTRSVPLSDGGNWPGGDQFPMVGEG